MKTKPRPKNGQTRDTREAMREILSSHPFTSAQAATLMAIHLRMGQDGSGWVSQKDIMSFAHLGQTAITNATKALENIGVLEVDRRNRGADPKPNVYRLKFSSPAKRESVSTHRLPPNGSRRLPPDGTEVPVDKYPIKKNQEEKSGRRSIRFSRHTSRKASQENKDRVPSNASRSNREVTETHREYFRVLDELALQGYASPKQLEHVRPELDREDSIAVIERWKNVRGGK